MRSLIARREHSGQAPTTDEAQKTPSGGGAPYGRPGAPANPGSPGGGSAPGGGPTVGGKPVEGAARPSWLGGSEGGGAPAGAAGGTAAPGGTGAPGMEERRSTESTLIVGPNIKLKGEIAACDTLVVEGTIEAAMDSHHIAIAKGGVFSGKVTVDTAEVAGAFDGDLTVRDRLLVRASGSISGTVRYGALEVEHGGRLSGSLELLSEAEKRSASSAASSSAAGGARPEAKARVDDGSTTPPQPTQPA